MLADLDSVLLHIVHMLIHPILILGCMFAKSRRRQEEKRNKRVPLTLDSAKKAGEGLCVCVCDACVRPTNNLGA